MYVDGQAHSCGYLKSILQNNSETDKGTYR
jgi:hypothetical protein